METGVIVQYDDIIMLPQLDLLFSYFFSVRVKIENTTRRWLNNWYLYLENLTQFF